MEANSSSELVTGQRVPAAKAEGCQSTLFVPQCLLHPLAQQLNQLAKADSFRFMGPRTGNQYSKAGVGGRAPRFRFPFLKARNAL